MASIVHNGPATVAGSALSNEMPQQGPRMLAMSTGAFMVSFAALTIFSIIGLQIQKDHGLSETQLGLLLATPILTVSVLRILLGILCDLPALIILPLKPVQACACQEPGQ
jgi:hypothetical protein